MILLDKTVKIYRLQDVDSNKSAYSTLTTSLQAAIQPASESEISNAGGSFSKAYKIYMDVNIDVNEGDELRDQNGNIYKVDSGGVENRDDGFISQHLDLTVRKVNT